jgi:broad specificity phosphatase PhoE
MRLILVRHGETAYNRDRLTLGRADLPLTELGLRQAEALGKRLADESLTAVVSSPLQRALRTAEVIASSHGISIAPDERFIEMDIGAVEGLTFAEVTVRHPELRANWGGADGPLYRMPGSNERLVDVQARACKAVEDLAGVHANRGVCVVTHNFVILSLLAWATGIELAEFRRLKHDVAAISVIDLGGDRPAVLAMNDRCHLSGCD